MKTLTLFVLFTVTASARHLPYIPTPDDTTLALSSARFSWGVDVAEPIVFRTEPLGVCKLGVANPKIAVLEVLDTGARFNGEAVAGSRSYVIRINSNCDWSRLSLAGTVLYEYGRILMPAYRNADPRSIMYGVVMEEQCITDEDRIALALLRQL